MYVDLIIESSLLFLRALTGRSGRGIRISVLDDVLSTTTLYFLTGRSFNGVNCCGSDIHS